MIRAFHFHQNRLVEAMPDLGALEKDMVWIDLLNPTPDEDHAIEKLLGISIPTRDEIREIEISNTLYQENGAVYVTASLITQSDGTDPQLDAVSFIQVKNILVTLRYTEPKSFDVYITKATHIADDYGSGAKILGDILNIVVGRCADGLERSARMIEDSNRMVFRPSSIAIKSGTMPKTKFDDILVQIGSTENVIVKIVECLVSIGRICDYLHDAPCYQDKADELRRLRVMTRDVTSLRDYANAMAEKAEFLLDATLGMISIEQNTIFKIFAVINTVFLAPTLIASIYGMNFKIMPELDWHVGYPMAIGLMILSAWVPWAIFKKKGWL